MEEMADLYEMTGESVFKIRAFRRGAEQIAGLGEDIAAVAARAELRKIPGIGEGLAEKIQEFLALGRVQAHDDLLKKIPHTVLDLLTVPGLGPKRAKQVFDALGVKSLPELRKAAETGKLRDLPGFGKVLEEKILRGTAIRELGMARTLYPVALEAAANVMEHLKGAAGIVRMDVAGSLRRKRETVQDVDILVAAREKDAAKIIARFTGMPGVREKLAEGSTKGSVILASGLQIDLRVIPLESWGAALQYFTGSKAHNVRLREEAVRKGFKINEYGLFRVAKNGKEMRVAGASEEEIYERLGFRYIPPELREDRGELDAARRDALPRLVERRALRGDFHTHSTWSDGRASIEEMARAARAAGLEWLVLSDHSPSLTVARGLTVERLREKQKEIKALNARLDGIRILCGSEVDILKDGGLDYPEEILAELDIVVASVHSAFGMPEPEMTARILKAIQSPHVDILGHPTGRLIGKREPYAVDLDQVIRAAARTGTVLEINGQPERLDLDDTHCQAARALGVRFAISSDAHATGQFVHLDYGIGVARRAWLEPGDILNTKPWREIETCLN